VALPRDEAGYRAFIATFEAAAIPRGEWNHPEHVAVAVWYLGREEEQAAIARIRAGIQKLNAARGIAQTPTGGYHESWTVFFALLIARFLARPEIRALAELERLARAVEYLRDFRAITREHYSPERINSWEARTSWLPPDLKPLE
jgi:hypothetical protein